MKRWRRWILSLAAGASLTIAVAASTLWIVNLWIGTTLGWAGKQSVLVLHTEKNLLTLTIFEYSQFGPVGWWGGTYPTPHPDNYNGGWNELANGRFNEMIGFPVLGLVYRQQITPTTLPAGIMLQDNSFDPAKHGNKRIYKVYVPHWFLLLVAAPWPSWLLIQRIRGSRRQRRREQNLCLTCGYDLRATPDRCPECGAVPEAAKGAAK